MILRWRSDALERARITKGSEHLPQAAMGEKEVKAFAHGVDESGTNSRGRTSHSWLFGRQLYTSTLFGQGTDEPLHMTMMNRALVLASLRRNSYQTNKEVRVKS